MVESIARPTANLVIVVGLLLFVKVVHSAATGSLSAELFAEPRSSWLWTLYALVLSLPVPFHVVSVGLILKRRFLSPVWARVAWVAVVTSGCWLGVALAIKLLVL